MLIADVTGVLIQADTLCSQDQLYWPRQHIRRGGYNRILSGNVLIWARQYLNMVFVFRYIRIIEMRRHE